MYIDPSDAGLVVKKDGLFIWKKYLCTECGEPLALESMMSDIWFCENKRCHDKGRPCRVD